MFQIKFQMNICVNWFLYISSFVTSSTLRFFYQVIYTLFYHGLIGPLFVITIYCFIMATLLAIVVY